MKKGEKTIEDFFEAKNARRRKLANLPIEEKVKILVKLQNIAAAVFAMRGLKKRPWKL